VGANTKQLSELLEIPKRGSSSGSSSKPREELLPEGSQEAFTF
jgi:hypothetical protein